MKYFLFVFAKHEQNQEGFVKLLSEEISEILENEDIGYYFGSESIIFSFNVDKNLSDLKDFLSFYLGEIGIVYFMLPFEPDKMSYWLDPEIEDLLMNPEKNNGVMSLIDENNFEAQKLFCEIFDEDEIYSPMNIIKKESTLDDLLDKITENGYDSLTTNEIKLLNEFSKK